MSALVIVGSEVPEQATPEENVAATEGRQGRRWGGVGWGRWVSRCVVVVAVVCVAQQQRGPFVLGKR